MLSILKRLVPLKIKIILSYQLVRLKGKLDSGNKVECNICGNHYTRFGNFGGRQSVLCPGCFSLERHRLVYQYLKDKTGVFTKPMRVLHFAAEKCINEKLTQNKELEYETADLLNQFMAMIEVKPKHQMSVTDIQFPDNHFDLILCNHVLEHVPDDVKAMSELYRVMKPGGLGIFQVPIDAKTDEIKEDYSLGPDDRKKYYGSIDHVRMYAEKGYINRLSSVGFQVEANDFRKQLDGDRLRLDAKENLILCRKGGF